MNFRTMLYGSFPTDDAVTDMCEKFVTDPVLNVRLPAQ